MRDLVGFARSVDAQSLVEKTPSLMPLEPSQAGPILSPGELSDALADGMLLPLRAPGPRSAAPLASPGQTTQGRGRRGQNRNFATELPYILQPERQSGSRALVRLGCDAQRHPICRHDLRRRRRGARGPAQRPRPCTRGKRLRAPPLCRVTMPLAPSATPPGPLLRRLSAAGGVLRAAEADQRGLSPVSLCLGPAEGLGPRLLALLDRALTSHELSVVPVYGGLVRESDCAPAQLWATLFDHGKGRVFRCEECSGVAASDTRKRRRFCSNACKQAYLRHD